MRQSSGDCVGNFLTRRQAHGAKFAVLPAGTDYTDSKIYVRAALHRGEQRLDLLHSSHIGFAHPINDHAAFNSCLVCWAAWFDCRNQNAAPAQITERITE